MKKYIFFSSFIFLFAFFTANSQADEANESPWINNSTAIEELSEEAKTPTTFYGGNIDCVNRKVVTSKEFKLFGTIKVPFINEVSHDACSIKTKFGFLSNTGYLTRNSTSVAGKIHYKHSGGVINNLTFIPNSDKVLMKTQQGVRVFDNFDKLLTSEYKNNSVKHYLDTATSAKYLLDTEGNKISIDVYPIGVSSNGRWLVSESSAGGIIRYDLETDEYIVFDRNFNHNNGIDPQARYTVSADGRYVVVASTRQQRLSLFDLENCKDFLPKKSYQDCARVDLLQKFRDKYHDFLSGSNIRFAGGSNYVLSLNISYKDGLGEKFTKKALIWPEGYGSAEIGGYGYLALGDSFASGEGAHEYKPGTDQKDPLNKCHVSQISYPFLIGDELGLNQYESVACSGAVIEDVRSENRDVQVSSKDSQSNGVDLSDGGLNYVLESFLTGYIPQLAFIDKYKPSVVTLSISGNDIGFGDTIKKCVVFEVDCYSSYESRYNKIQEINNTYQELADTYSAIKDLTVENAKIYAVGYPSLVKEGGYCELNVRLSQQEIIFANQLVKYLNLVIEKAAINAGIVYVDVEEALDGHKLCSPVFSHEIAVNGLTAGDDTWFDIGPLGKESYHPNAIGHRMLKDAIIAQTEGFNTTIEDGQTTEEAPHPSDSSYLLENVPYEGGEIFSAFGTISVKETILDFHTKVTSEGYAPGSSVYLELHSDPIDLGEFTANENGVVEAEVDLPSDVPAGFHTLYAYGKNLLGEDVRSEAIVYVAASEDDLDGDGLKNENDQCLVFDQSGIDQDGDGLDDACDGFVGEKPSEEVVDTDEVRSLPGFNSSPDDTAIIEGVNETNTQTQAGQNGQNLQPGGSQAQTTASGFQAGSAINTSTNNAAAALNQGVNAGNLNVGVASASSKTSVEGLSSSSINGSTIPASYIFVPLLLLIVFALVLAYRRAKKFDEKTSDNKTDELELMAETTHIIKTKRKRKKPKKPHHH